MAKTVNIWLDGKHLEVPDTMTIIEVADQNEVYIPRLCYHPDLPPTANCGVCVVELGGNPTPKRACCTPVSEGMKIVTNSKKLRAYRKTLVEMILSNHDVSCPSCVALRLLWKFMPTSPVASLRSCRFRSLRGAGFML